MGTPVFTGFPPVDPPAAPTTNSSTPMKPKHAQSAPPILNGLESGRTAVMQDTGEVVRQVSLEYFFDSLLPKLPERLKLDAVIDRLKDEKVKAITKGGCWSGFSTTPSKSTKTEDDTFRPFENVAVAIGKAATYVMPGRKLKQRVVFKCNPTTVPLSSLRDNSSKPDSYGLSTCHHRYDEESRSPHWEVVVVPGEKKKRHTPETVTDNNRKMMWSLNHIMREDVRRRFVFGYTIEDCNMRLWFGSRADLLVSESFNFIKDHKTFAHFILSFMYAKEAELGYDTTMMPVTTPTGLEQGQHKIAVRGPDGKDTIYLTRRMISNIGAESIRGRGTRVWEAVQLRGRKPVGDPVALKDTWIDDDRAREGAILDQIKKDSEGHKQQDIFQRSLLTILTHGDVYVGGQHDQTHTLLRRNCPVPEDLDHYPLKAPEVRQQVDIAENTPNAPVGSGTIRPQVEKKPVLLKFGVKAHYRIVFKEVATSIESLTSVGDIFKILCEALIAVKILHEIGWLHRDISSGNLLIHNEHAKLTDFEYAKRADDQSEPHNLRTGTAKYMAVEADDHVWRFVELPAKREELDFDALVSRLGSGRKTNLAPDLTKAGKKAPPFRHIALHDLESVWWLAVYLTVDRSVVLEFTKDGIELSYYTAHEEFYDELFDNRAVRVITMTTNNHFSSGEEHVHPSMLLAAKSLDVARERLIAEYRVAEQNIEKIDHKVGAGVATAMLEVFLYLMDHYTEDENKVAVRAIRATNLQLPPPPREPAPRKAAQSLGAQPTIVLGKRDRKDDTKMHIASQAGPSSSKPVGTKRARQEPVSEGEGSLEASDVDESATTPPRSRSPSIASTMAAPLAIPIPRGKGKGKERARD